MLISQSLLITAIGYEQAKQLAQERSQALWRSFESRVAAFADSIDQKHYKAADCDGTILCQREGVRHKTDCQGRTEPFEVYAKALGSIQ